MNWNWKTALLVNLIFFLLLVFLGEYGLNIIDFSFLVKAFVIGTAVIWSLFLLSRSVEIKIEIVENAEKPKKKPTKSKFTTGMYFSLFLPYLLPILGGLIVNRIYKKENEEFGYFSLASSMFNPLLLQYIIGFIVGFLFPSVVEYYPLSLNLIVLIAGVFFCWLMLSVILKDNIYKNFYPVYWFGLLGAIYSWSVEKNKEIKEQITRFVIVFIFVAIFVNYVLPSLI